MKKRAMLLNICLAMIFAGCGNGTEAMEGKADTATSGSVIEAGRTTDEAVKTTAGYKGYVFVYGDVAIGIDAEAEPLIGRLGEADAYFEAPSCAFEGVDKMYTYNGFELDTYPMNGKDYVSAVTFKDDMVSTAEGISIGDTEEKVKKAYGECAADKEGVLAYEKDGMKLCFIVQAGSVMSIEYHSTVLDE